MGSREKKFMNGHMRVIDGTRMILMYENDDGEEIEFDVPWKNEVCDDCEGHGTHLTPSIRNHAYSQEEFAEAFDDDEDREHYFQRGGKYDVPCETCHGNKVMPTPNEDAIKEAKGDKGEELKKNYAAWQESMETSARYEAEDRHTRRMESGGFDC